MITNLGEQPLHLFFRYQRQKNILDVEKSDIPVLASTNTDMDNTNTPNTTNPDTDTDADNTNNPENDTANATNNDNTVKPLDQTHVGLDCELDHSLADSSTTTISEPTDLISIDSVIMDSYCYGVEYFDHILSKLSELTTTFKTGKQYLQTYLKLYLQHSATLKNVTNFVGPSSEKIQHLYTFFGLLKRHNFSVKVINLWLDLVYDFFLAKFQDEFSKPVLDALSMFLNCNQFRIVFYDRELNNKLTATEIESHTILGSLMVHQTSDVSVNQTQKALFPLVFKFNEAGSSFFVQWLSFVYSKNRGRAHVQTISGQANFTSDDCMVGLLRFTLCVWCDFFKQRLSLEEFHKDDYQGTSLSVFIHRLVEVSVIPIVTKLQYCQDNLQELDYEDNTTIYTYLEQFKQSLRRRITYYENFIKDMIPTVIEKVFFFYSWISGHLGKIGKYVNQSGSSSGSDGESEDDSPVSNDNNTVNNSITVADHQTVPETNTTSGVTAPTVGNTAPDELVESIMNFTLLFTEYMTQEQVDSMEALLYPIQQLSYQVLTGIIPVSNSHIKIKAFQCYYCFTAFHIKSTQQDSSRILTSLLELYQTCQKSEDLTTKNVKSQIIIYLYEKIEYIKSEHHYRNLGSNELEKFLSSFVSELNHYLERSVQNINSLVANSDLANTESIKSYTTRIIYYTNIHLRLATKILPDTEGLSQVSRIIPSIINCLSYNTQFLTQVCQTVEGIPNCYSIINNFRKLFLALVRYPEIMTGLVHNNDTFSLANFKTICDFTVSDSIAYQDFETSYLELRKKLPSDTDMTEIPDEFCDPLLCVPITDPVVIPGTTNIMERTVIERHLLETSENPFNRASLTLEQLVDHQQTASAQQTLTEFTTKRSAWLETQKKQQTNQSENPNESSDVSSSTKAQVESDNSSAET